MTFTVREFHDLVELLEEQPTWRAELRRLVFTDDLVQLPKIVQKLAAAQQELAAAQQRTEQRVEELAAAQQRTEQRVEELVAAQQELAAAQRRTEERIDTLAEALQATRTEVGRLTTIFGSTLEEEAADILSMVLEEQGYLQIGEELNVRFNGEVDVAIAVKTGQGESLTAVIESKVRLGGRAVQKFASRMRSEGYRKALERAGLPGPYRVYVYGIRVDAAARQAAEKIGVGLLTSRGEQLAPREESSGI